MLIPPLIPPVVSVPLSGGPPTVPDRSEPACAECVALGNALRWAQRADDSAYTRAVRDRVRAHFDAGHAA
ncbi:hypothetical protein [Streptomyces sp. UNOC14_S4]|uniref:hypothetical protein n=1 Tax=Streptomyces sp. UNOC14_S4 TaxID=2872340 RepID=UPI001E378007|nr:hypothetical protein [Streptomyces sp. UNOC14_S4]MCC3769720.1 hypothetical protein [Streptomyces sp. UNOC14_S4]